MKSSVFYGILAALVTWFFMYLDSKLFDSPKTKGTYIKNMVFVGSLVCFGIKLLGENKFDDAFGNPFGRNYSQGGRGYYDYGIREEIMTGMPDF